MAYSFGIDRPNFPPQNLYMFNICFKFSEESSDNRSINTEKRGDSPRTYHVLNPEEAADCELPLSSPAPALDVLGAMPDAARTSVNSCLRRNEVFKNKKGKEKERENGENEPTALSLQ
jgi:hypothetical protein